MSVECVYLDSALTEPAQNRILLEGSVYFVDCRKLPTVSVADRTNRLASQRVQVLPRNTVGTLNLSNVAGWLDLGGIRYDVRSEKLGDGQTGAKQLQALIDDIVSISKGLSFRYTGAGRADREIDWQERNARLLERFDYFRQLVLDGKPANRLDCLISAILRNPHHRMETDRSYVSIDRAKRPGPRQVAGLSRRGDFRTLPDNHPLNRTPFARLLKTVSGTSLFPVSIGDVIAKPSTDTQENRFVRWFLDEILRTADEVGRLYRKVPKIKTDAETVRSKVLEILQHPLFANLGDVWQVPEWSPVLRNRSGYRELYRHYLDSHKSYRDIVSDLRRIDVSAGLKDIASLYEIWVFFRVAKLLFGHGIERSPQTRLLKNNSITYAFSFEDDDFRLSFNETFSSGHPGSYSVPLRPDVTIHDKRRKRRLALDAKYRFREIDLQGDEQEIGSLKPGELDESPQVVRDVRSADIHKMHAYRDAIDGMQSAIVVFPGDKETFFAAPGGQPETPEMLSGVGAIPLRPGRSDDELAKFIADLRSTAKK